METTCKHETGNNGENRTNGILYGSGNGKKWDVLIIITQTCAKVISGTENKKARNIKVWFPARKE